LNRKGSCQQQWNFHYEKLCQVWLKIFSHKECLHEEAADFAVDIRLLFDTLYLINFICTIPKLLPIKRGGDESFDLTL